MGISKQPPKKFPITKGLPCQLKWTFSTIYLTDGKSASCHKARMHDYNVDGKLNFHNQPGKINERLEMLDGKWPAGCESCKHIEESGGHSDRVIQLFLEGNTAPPELEKDLEATTVTPRQIEIYWGNTCNMKCIYCAPHYSNKIHAEQKRFGKFDQDGVSIDPDDFKLNPNIKRDTDRLFEWFEKNIQHLHKIYIFGGEPFLQVETERMIKFLEERTLPDLTLTFFSNLNVDHERVKRWVERLENLRKQGRLDKLVIVGSLDAWGEPGEYVRSGLDLKLFEKNFEYILHNTSAQQQINSALTITSVPGMVQMVEKINDWNKVKPVYWSFLKAADKDSIGGTGYLYPGIFGKKINSLGLEEAIEKFDTNTAGYPDSVKIAQKKYMQGHVTEFANATPDLHRQKQLKTYLSLLDRRRGTDYTKVFPEISAWLKDL